MPTETVSSRYSYAFWKLKHAEHNFIYIYTDAAWLLPYSGKARSVFS